MQKYLNNCARILKPVKTKGGSLKAAGVKESNMDQSARNRDTLSHWRVSTQAHLNAKDFMLCKVVRRTNVRRADGRPPKGSNEGAGSGARGACLFPRSPNGMILSSSSRLRLALCPYSKRLAPLFLAERVKPWSVVRCGSLLGGGCYGAMAASGLV
ncbi:hypothetical protein N431DRAFT_424871 [Stipitochalara longipes BDJ]|nr:hypothetical protein N431DRAFT_424871 [Stipitochalara longipes BDJ]